MILVNSYGQHIPYFIGEAYKFPDEDKHLKLVSVEKYRFVFSCQFWCTDLVFQDLIRVKTGRQVLLDVVEQRSINFNY